MLDTKAGFHVEFVKDPRNIDEAVDEVVNFQEVRKKQGRSTRRVESQPKQIEIFSSDDSDMEISVARAPGRPPKAVHSDNKEESGKTETGNSKIEETLAKMTKQLEDLGKENIEYKKQIENHRYAPYSLSNPKGNLQPRGPARAAVQQPSVGWPKPGYLCFKCHQPGHMMRDCQMVFTQLEMASNMPTNQNWNQSKPNEQRKPMQSRGNVLGNQ